MTSDYEKTRSILLGMSVEAVMLEKDLSGSVADYFGKWLTGQYAIVAREQLAHLKGAERFKAIQAVVHDCSLLCRGEQNAERLRIEREWLTLAKEDSFAKYKRRVVHGMETLFNCLEKNPEAMAAFRALADHIRNPNDPEEQQMWKEKTDAEFDLTRSNQIRPNPTKSDHERN